MISSITALRKHCYSRFTPQCFKECPFFIEGLTSKKGEILKKASVDDCLEWLSRAVPAGFSEPIEWLPKSPKTPKTPPSELPLRKAGYEESMLDSLLNILRKKITAYYSNLCLSGETIDPQILQLAMDIRSELENYARATCRGDAVNPSRLGALKCKFVNSIRESPAPNLDHPAGFSWRDFQNQLDDLLRKAFADVTRAKYQRNRELNQIAIADVREIKVLPLLEWATLRLEQLPPFPIGDKARDRYHGSEWVGLAIALMIVTGRRQSEILSSGEFSPADCPKKCFFDGQLKRHIDEPMEPYEIPILCNFDLVDQGMKWLEAYNKRCQPTERTVEGFRRCAEISNRYYGGRISQGWRQLQDLVPITNGKEWQVIGKNHFRPHLSRQIYAELAYMIHNSSNFKKRYYVASILGEGSALAGLPYDRDIAIADADVCLDFLNGLK